MLTAVDGAVQLVVDRPYKTGEPIVVWYGLSYLHIFSFFTPYSFLSILFFSS